MTWVSLIREKGSGDTSLIPGVRSLHQTAVWRSVLRYKPICTPILHKTSAGPRIQDYVTRLLFLVRGWGLDTKLFGTSQLTCTFPVDLCPQWLQVGHQETGYAGVKEGWQVVSQEEGGAVVGCAHAKRKDHGLCVWGREEEFLWEFSIFKTSRCESLNVNILIGTVYN